MLQWQPESNCVNYSLRSEPDNRNLGKDSSGLAETKILAGAEQSARRRPQAQQPELTAPAVVVIELGLGGRDLREADIARRHAQLRHPV